MFGVSREMISQIETGRANINAGDLPRLAKILMVPISYFYGGIEYPPSFEELELPPRVSIATREAMKAASDHKKFIRTNSTPGMSDYQADENTTLGLSDYPSGNALNPDEEELLSFFRGINSEATKRIVIQTAKSLFEIEHQRKNVGQHQISGLAQNDPSQK